MVKETVRQEFLLTTIIYFEHIMLVQQSCWVLILLWTLLLSWSSCGSQVKAQPSCGHIFHTRSCVRRDYPSEAMEIVSYCTKSGRVSRKLGIEEIPFHNQVTSGDIDDIQDHRCRMSRRTFFYPQIKIYHRTRYYARRFAWAWMAVCAWSPSPRGLATLNPQSTCHGPRPGPKLARGVRSGSLRATDTRERETTGGRDIKKMPTCQKTH